jgi:outer membrane biosynthesis protein TonB
MTRIANRFARLALVIPVLSLGLMLAGCETFDPTDITEIFNTKKKLPGDRKAVFPEGTPGVPQGVPSDLVKGYQAEETVQQLPPQAAAVEPEKPKAKPKPKPKVVAKPAESTPTAVTVRPAATGSAQSDAPQAQAEPQQQQQPPTGGGWSGAQRGGSMWPDPPPMR